MGSPYERWPRGAKGALDTQGACTQRKALAANSLIVNLTHTYTLDVAESDGSKARDAMRHDGLGSQVKCARFSLF